MTREATASDRGANAIRPLRPLTERILARLPGRRAPWFAAWALVPWLNAGANLLVSGEGTSAVWEQGRALVVLNYAALSFAVVVTLWGARRIVRRLEGLRAPMRAMLDKPADEPFGAMNSVAGPIVLSVATAVAFGVTAFVRDGTAAGLLRGSTWFVIGIAFWTFLWIYGSLHLGLDRLGRARIDSGAVRNDPGFGLRPLGDVAFTALWILLAWLVPILLTGLPDVVGVVVGLTVLAVGLGAFFLSLFRLHGKMVDFKAHELEIARSLYARAYEPVRSTPTLDVLEQQHRLLAAADSLEKRAHALHDWPIDEGTFARVLTITTSVIGITIARLILDPFGL